MDADPQVLIVAGEVSGDIHAGNLLAQLRRLVPGVRAFGVGGERLAAAGFEAVHSTAELAHMGLTEVLRELPRLRGIMNGLVRLAAARRPRVAVLVDSPDFNLRLAARLGRLGIPVVLFVSPQLWAWRKGRVRTVRRVAREVLCILPFEVDFYEQHGVPARFVGHPLVDDLEREGLLGSGGEIDPRRLALLPGSRTSEVEQLLPVMMWALAALPRDEVAEAAVIAAPGVEEAIRRVLASFPADERLRVVGGPGRRRVLAASALAWTASGTATLECALLDVPMIVGYRLRRLSYWIARSLVSVPHIALVNLIAGRRLVPELVQGSFEPRLLERETRRLLAGGGGEQRAGFVAVRERLGRGGASARAAAAVAAYLGDGRGDREPGAGPGTEVDRGR